MFGLGYFAGSIGSTLYIPQPNPKDIKGGIVG
jgi:hypothetical protein